MTSPGRFRPPVLSEPVSQRCHRPPSQASHTSGGWRGSTPTPSTRLSRRTATTQRGTAVGRPNSRASPGSGVAWKHGVSRPSASAPVRSVRSPVRGEVTRRVNSLGTIRRSPVVAKTTASSLSPVSPAAVVTSVPHGQRHRLGLRSGQPEVDVGEGGRGRVQLDVQQVQERQVVLVRDPVQPVQQLVDEVGERLDQGDARVGDVVVGPLGGALLHVPLRLVDELLEPSVVQVGGGQGHQSATISSAPSSEGIV